MAGDSKNRIIRTGRDRRHKPTPPLSRYSFLGRRKYNRRRDDPNRNYYVDRYGKKSVATVCLILTLCITDGFFTLYLIEHGAQEINPVMAWALNFGATFFLAVKYTLTGVCLIGLLIHKNFYLFKNRVSVKSVMLLFLGGYVLLIVYEMTLLLKL